jgi:diguanylate cyclase (GGDEF)-like protein
MDASQTKATSASLADRYRVLLGIGSSLAGVLSEDDIYASVHRETTRVLEADGFYIVLHDPETDEAEVVYWADRGEGRRSRIPFRGSESEVIRTGAPVRVSDRLADRSLLILGDDRSSPTRSAASAPMRAGDEVVGALSVQSYRAGAYGDAEMELLQGIADVASVAIRNARHVTELDRRREEAERVLEIARALTASLDDREVLRQIVHAALELLASDGAAVWLLEEAGARVGASDGELAPREGALFPLEGEVVPILMDDRDSVIIEDLPTSELLSPANRRRLKGRSSMIVPLVSGERSIGALSVCSSATRIFHRDEARLLQRLAGHATLALENARLHARLRALSLTDPLTGLPNRRHLEMHLGQEFAAAKRGRRLSVVLFDLDDFKQYNDALGHLAGDDALRAVGKILSGETRAMNLVARYGGDEFVTVLSDTTKEGARRHAARVAARLVRHPLLGPLSVSLSFGVAEYREGVEGVDDLLRAADQDLYRSKGERGARS